MNEASSPHLRLGRQCRELRRFADAERHFQDAIAADPRDDIALHELALTVHLQDGRDAEALEIIDDAIRLDPNHAAHHAARAFILNELDRPREALIAAGEARRLDPYGDAALVAAAQSYTLQRDWAEAERLAREALAIDADNSSAANLLAQALRMQKKTVENDAQIAGLLARDPDDPSTHLNAGWSALQRGDHRTAEQHFREALRIRPDLDAAREGLLTSFRARSPIYRGYLRYAMWMARHKTGTRWAIILGLLLGVRILRSIAYHFSPTLAIAVVALYLIFVVSSYVADAFGNFILLADRFARHALRPAEKREALAVGGAVVLGLLLLAAGLLIPNGLALALAGGVLLLASLPFSMVFTNRSRSGAILFAAIGATPLLGLVLLLFGNTSALSVLMIGLVGCLLSTWLGAIPSLRRR